MGDVASVVKVLSRDRCAKYVCSGMHGKSQCYDEEDGFNCESATESTKMETKEEDLEIEMDNGCEGLCCNFIMRTHK